MQNTNPLCATEVENKARNEGTHIKAETALTIDDRRHGQDDTIAVVDDGVHRLVFNNVKVMLQVAVCLYQSKERKVSTAQKDKPLF